MLTFGKQGLLITACWIPVKTLQLVSKASKVLEARDHNASTYFQISFAPIFAVLRKMQIMSKFLSYPFYTYSVCFVLLLSQPSKGTKANAAHSPPYSSCPN